MDIYEVVKGGEKYEGSLYTKYFVYSAFWEYRRTCSPMNELAVSLQKKGELNRMSPLKN